ncbi:hypothetical protein [Companilactobacillus hulinensis]|uniref:hypothetical protein n=1 Tax=Companilactobacillus hulinensis TaxID=2486007 RepID=UPI0013DDB7BD|nr:hypothetical protein [Companilactobacillus hulinensis]
MKKRVISGMIFVSFLLLGMLNSLVSVNASTNTWGNIIKKKGVVTTNKLSQIARTS